MTDIVKRLRARAAEEHEMLGDIHIPLLEAAETIERLRATLESIAKNTCCEGCGEAALVARAALEEKA